MKSLSATEAARRFSYLLDAVESRGETFLVSRHGRAVARIGPASGGRGSVVKDLLRTAPRDPAWVEGVRQLRSALQIEERRWSG